MTLFKDGVPNDAPTTGEVPTNPTPTAPNPHIVDIDPKNKTPNVPDPNTVLAVNEQPGTINVDGLEVARMPIDLTANAGVNKAQDPIDAKAAARPLPLTIGDVAVRFDKNKVTEVVELKSWEDFDARWSNIDAIEEFLKDFIQDLSEIPRFFNLQQLDNALQHLANARAEFGKAKFDEAKNLAIQIGHRPEVVESANNAAIKAGKEASAFMKPVVDATHNAEVAAEVSNPANMEAKLAAKGSIPEAEVIREKNS